MLWWQQLCFSVVLGDRLAGLQVNFQRADNAPPVGRVQARTRFRVDRFEAREHGFDSRVVHLSFQLFAHAGRWARGERAPEKQTVCIEPCPAAHNAGFAARQDILQNGLGELDVFSNGKIFLRACCADHMVRYALHF